VPHRPAPERLEADLAHWQEELRTARETSDLPNTRPPSRRCTSSWSRPGSASPSSSPPRPRPRPAPQRARRTTPAPA
jgi:hypothetical protein